MVLILLVFPAFGQQERGTISSGDLVYVEVYRVPELTLSIQVDGDGNITLPYVGSINVGGMSEAEASGRVSQALRKILRNPRVTVARSSLPAARVPVGRGADMTMEIVPLQNSSAESLSAVLSGMSTEGGNISHDPDTNTLIITDTPTALRNIMNVVARIDQMQSQLTQVRIETRIAEVRVGAMKELGIRWWAQGTEGLAGFLPPPRQDPSINLLRGGISPFSNETVGSSASSQSVNDVGRRFVNNDIFDRRLNVPVNVPIPGQAFFGLANAHIDIGTMLDMLVSDNKAELLASPVLLTVNHKTARIRMVDEIPFTEFGTEITGATSFSTRFLELGITLDVTPHVYRDSHGTYVKLELHPEVSFPIGSSNGVPIRSVRSSESVASVRDGQTLVVGGILREDERYYETKVPGLGNLPLVGRLFKHTERAKIRTELMIFVTPTVHRRPEEITWDKMIDISRELKRAALIPTAELQYEARRD